MPLRAFFLAFLVALIPATAAIAHQENPFTEKDTSYQWGEQNSPTFSAAMRNVPDPAAPEGPCTDYAKRTMPAHEGHDHTDIDQHRFACEMQTVAFESMAEQFKARPDVVFGEMDVKGDLAVVAIAYPESGFVLFDISDTSNPKFLSWYRGDECEGLAIDVDCGAFVDLSPDGKRVYVSVQQISVVPGGAPPARPALTAYPGIDVIDISDRKAPRLTQKLPVQSIGGVHTTRSFAVPDKGEYTVSVANGMGAAIHKLDPASGTLEEVTVIEMDELHDTFIQRDPLTGKTLLYIAGGFDSGFYVYDVSDPAKPVGLAEWDLTPECANDWYAHTLDVTTINGRRIVTLPNELIDFFGDQSEADQEQGCGKLQGNGDFAGPMFIVDATDFSKLGEIDAVDSNAEEEKSDMKARSEASLITLWVERGPPRRRRADVLAAQPADRRGQDLPLRLPQRGHRPRRERGVRRQERPAEGDRRDRAARRHDAADPPRPRRHAGLPAVLHLVHRLPPEHLGHAVAPRPGARGGHGRRLLLDPLHRQGRTSRATTRRRRSRRRPQTPPSGASRATGCRAGACGCGSSARACAASRP
jgi:hypothetical protein